MGIDKIAYPVGLVNVFVQMKQAMTRAVFLDRDGVINKAIVKDGKPYPPSDISEMVILPGVPEALQRLRSASFRLIVITNQPDVVRGTQTRENIEAMNAWLRTRLPLDEIRTCYHDDADNCSCRKPSPGLIMEAAKDSQLDLAQSFMVGDRWRDIEAGQRAGCTTFFVENGYSERQPEQPTFRVSSLFEAVDRILAR